jgi:hypothetical protein
MRLIPLPALGRRDRGGADQQASQRGLIGRGSMADARVRQCGKKPLCARGAFSDG